MEGVIQREERNGAMTYPEAAAGLAGKKDMDFQVVGVSDVPVRCKNRCPIQLC
jgi:hypothetical protein